MAKGNMLLGTLRGPVGDVSFSRINGQQISKLRNREPNNPRTLAQSFQRARFAAAVKFFTRGNQNFYKFAFENKRNVESDYNAFMRENVKIAPAISKAAFDNYAYPVVAPFIMAKGSLRPIDVTLGEANAVVNLGVAVGDATVSTVGELSALLISDARFNAGDILTFVFLSSTYDGAYPSVTADGTGATNWDIRQIILDPSATASLADVLGMSFVATDGAASLSVSSTAAPLGGVFSAMTCVHSRNTANGLKVSTQSLVLSASAISAYEATQEDSYKNAVAVSWQQVGKVDMQPEAILQGAIAYGEQDAAEPATGGNGGE